MILNSNLEQNVIIIILQEWLKTEKYSFRNTLINLCGLAEQGTRQKAKYELIIDTIFPFDCQGILGTHKCAFRHTHTHTHTLSKT